MAERLAEDAPARYVPATMLVDRIGIRARSRLFEMGRVVRMPKLPDHRLSMRRGGGRDCAQPWSPLGP